jgi:hypothetical protein
MEITDRDCLNTLVSTLDLKVLIRELRVATMGKPVHCQS